VQGVKPRNAEARRRGAERHSAHGRGVQRANRMAAWALALALVAAALLSAWALTALR
jgi:hypothetical protein